MIKTNNRNKLFSIIFCVTIISIIAVSGIPNSYEHAFVVKSDPAPSQSLSTPPSKVDLYFNDPVDIRYSQVKVIDSNGQQIQKDDLHYINGDQTTLSVSLPTSLTNGIYTVSSKVLDQTDGHVTENGFAFGIGQEVPKEVATSTASNYQEISIPEAAVRFPALVGQVMVAGIAAASLWAWGPISKISRLKDSVMPTRIKIDSMMAKTAVIGSIIIIASGFAMIVVQAYSINAGILDAISTKFGNMWVLRMITSSALLGLSFMMYQKAKKRMTVSPVQYTALLLGLSFSVLLTTSLISHGAATGQIIPFLLDFCHNVFASLWIGGIIYIAFVVMPQIKQMKDSNMGLAILSILIPRFSILVITVLGAVVITGPFLLYVLESNLALSLASFYGRVLIVKLVLAASMIAFGAYHQRFVGKKTLLAHAGDKAGNAIMQHESDSKKIISRFDTSIKIEALIGIALIASVAVLVDSGLPSSEFQNQLQSLQYNVFALTANDNLKAPGLSQTGFTDNGSRIVMSISPFATGNNDFTVSFLDSNKNQIDMKSAQLKLTQTDNGIGPITIDANKTGTGIFTANTSFGFPGHWTVRVEGVQNKENSLNLVYTYNFFVKPEIDSLQADIKEFKTPDNSSTPRYPVYDSVRNKVWVADTARNSGKILDFDLNTDKYTEHKVPGLNSAVYSALDSHGTLWYIDYSRNILGNYNPDSNSSKEYQIPDQGIKTGMAIDSNDTIWITSTNLTTHEATMLKFDTSTAKFESVKLPDKADPLGITIDNSQNTVWIAEGIGRVASMNMSDNKITEFTPPGNYTMQGPTGIISDSQTGKIYISEHEGKAVTVFDPLLKAFTRIHLDPNNDTLPYGMVFDKYHNLWVAQHTLDKISIIDPRTGEVVEKSIPSTNTSIQWLTTDSQGNVIMAEEQAHALAIATISAGQPSTSQASVPPVIPNLGADYVQVVAPSITGSLAVVAFFYSKSIADLRYASDQMKNLR